ncbi:MAG: phosphate signaling complex PhoU family protein [Phycisphaerales bacterium]
MPNTPQGFANRLQQLRAELGEQARRVEAICERAFETVFSRAPDQSHAIELADDEIDRVDVAVERAAVALLSDATHEGARLEPTELRGVLTVVKCNNELERIADCAVEIAEQARAIATESAALPDTFRVMTNSVLGILRDIGRSFERADPALAKVVLQSEDCVLAFKAAILRDAERRIASGEMHVEFALVLHEIANECCKIADHCTNIAEQIIYQATGAIVRHTDAGWVEVQRRA